MAHIADNSDAKDAIDNFSYTVTAVDSSYGSPTKEGDNVTFKIERTKADGASDLATTVYVTTTHSTTDDEDFLVKELEAVNFTAAGEAQFVTVSTYQDADTEKIMFLAGSF